MNPYSPVMDFDTYLKIGNAIAELKDFSLVVLVSLILTTVLIVGVISVSGLGDETNNFVLVFFGISVFFTFLCILNPVKILFFVIPIIVGLTSIVLLCVRLLTELPTLKEVLKLLAGIAFTLITFICLTYNLPAIAFYPIICVVWLIYFLIFLEIVF